MKRSTTSQQISERQQGSGEELNNTGARPFGRHILCRMTWLKQPRRLRQTSGAELLEFALALPFLLVIAVGISDFGGAYNTKHILTNAAREAARITISTPLSYNAGGCVSASPPCSIQGAEDAVRQYLTSAGLSTASCLTSASPSSGTLTWTYACKGVSLTIDRGQVIAGGPSGSVIPSTKVTLTYPYTWTFGRIIGLLVNGASATLPTSLTTTIVMQNVVA